MGKSKLKLAYISRNGSTWTCGHLATKQANYCCIPLSPKFSGRFIWAHILLLHLTCYWMFLTLFALPEMPPKVLLTSLQRSVCVHLSHFNILRCHWLLSCCGAVPFYLPCRRKVECLCLLSLSSLFFWELSIVFSEFFVGRLTSRTIVLSIYNLSLSLKYKQIGSTETTWSFPSLELSWACFIWNKNSVFSSAICSCLSTNLAQPKVYRSWLRHLKFSFYCWCV